MRITTNMQNNTIMNSMMSSQSQLAALQIQMATGQKINSASDNPSAVPSVMNANGMLNKIEMYKNNITYLNGEIEVTENTLGQVTEYIQRMKELTLEASNGTKSSDQLQLINDEIKQIKEQVVNLGNTVYQNSRIFAGNKTGTLPFAINDDGSITYHGTAGNEEYKREYAISEGVTLSINVAGDDVFGYSNLKEAGPPAVYEGTGLLHSINELSMLLESDTPDFDKIRSNLDNLEDAQNTVLAARTEMGGIQTRLNMTLEQHEDNKLSYQTIKSNLQEVDISQIITELSKQEVSLQASLYAGSQVMNISLLNYL